MNEIKINRQDEVEIIKEIVEKKKRLISIYFKKIDALRKEIINDQNDLRKICNHKWVIDRDSYDHKTQRYCIYCDLYN